MLLEANQDMDTGDSAAVALEKIWGLVVSDALSPPQGHFSGAPAKPGGFGALGFQGVRATFSVAEARSQGARLSVEMFGGRPFTFFYKDGVKYYLASKSGALWKVEAGPPSACSACGQFHWVFQCPVALGGDAQVSGAMNHTGRAPQE